MFTFSSPPPPNSKLENYRRWIFVLVSIYSAIAIVYYFLASSDALRTWFLTILPFIFWSLPLFGVYQRKEWGYRLLQFSAVLALGIGIFGFVSFVSPDFGDAIYNIFLLMLFVQVAMIFAVVALSSSSLKSFSVVADERSVVPSEPTAPVFSSSQENPAIPTPPAYQAAEKVVNELRTFIARLIIAVVIGVLVIFPDTFLLVTGMLFCDLSSPPSCSVEDHRAEFSAYLPGAAISFALGAISGWICAQSIIASFRKNQQWSKGYYGAIFGFFWGMLASFALFGFGSQQIMVAPSFGIIGMAVGFFGISVIYQIVRALVIQE